MENKRITIKKMNKEAFIKKLTLILEDFDSNRNADMGGYLDEIYSAAEIYFSDLIKKDREKAIKEFLTEQLNRRQS